jgi:hypothetical protein
VTPQQHQLIEKLKQNGISTIIGTRGKMTVICSIDKLIRFLEANKAGDLERNVEEQA